MCMYVNYYILYATIVCVGEWKEATAPDGKPYYW